MSDVLQTITAPAFLINIAIKSSLVLAMAGMLTFLLRHSAAALRHWIWCLALTALLLLPVLSPVLPSQQLTVLPTALSEKRELTKKETQIPPSKAVSGNELPASQNNSNESATSTTTLAKTMSSMWQWVGSIWLIGVCFLLTKRMLETVSVYRSCRKHRDGYNLNWDEDLQRMRSRVDTRRAVRLVFSPQAAVPFTMGIFRPLIVLPVAAMSWTPGQRRTVLLHELAHIKRFDYVGNLLAEIAKSVYWYHPMVWFAAQQLKAEREHATDDFVLRQGTDNITYADQLLTITRQLQQKSVIARNAVAMTNTNSLKKRMEHILAPEIARHSLTQKSALIWLVFLSLFCFALASVHLQAKALPDSPTVSVDVAGKSVDELLSLLDDSQPAVKIAALTELGRIGDRKSFYRVVKMLRDPEPAVRVTTLQAIYGIGCDPAFVAITVSLRDPHPVVREKAAVLLGRLTHKPMSKPVRRVLRDYSPQTLGYLRSVLGEMENLTAVDYLSEASADPVSSVRTAVRQTLEQLEHPGARQALSSANRSQTKTSVGSRSRLQN